MPYKPIFQLSFAGYNKSTNRIVITPRLNSGELVGDRLGYNLGNQSHRIYYIYSRPKSGVEVYKGIITSIYNSWCMVTPVPMNNLVKYDFLYERDHDAQLHPKAVGIMYELI